MTRAGEQMAEPVALRTRAVGMPGMMRAVLLTLIVCISVRAHVTHQLLTPAGIAVEKWGSSSFPIVWRLNTTRGSNVTGTRDLAEVFRQAFTTWGAVPTASVSFSEGATTTVAAAALDGINLIAVAPSSYSGTVPALTVIYSCTGSGNDPTACSGKFPGQIIEADILFNPSLEFSTESTTPANRLDLQSYATHEIGHLLGLDHTGLVPAVMFPSTASGAALRGLHTDDKLGLSNVYPAPAFFNSGGAVRGIVRTPGGSFVPGAHVVVVDAAGKPVASTLTNNGGMYEIRGLDSGSYSAYAEPLDGPLLPPAGEAGTNFATRFAATPVTSSSLTLTKISGDNQSGSSGQPLTSMLEVQVRDNSGNPVAGTTVMFASASGGAVVPISAMTDGAGKARTQAYLGKAGTQTFTAGASTATVSFTATADAPPVSSVTFLDPVSNATAKELIVNENNTIQARLRILDGLGNERADLTAAYTSLNTDIATVDAAGNVLGKKAGFATLSVAAGGFVATTTITVVQVTAGASTTETNSVIQDLAGRLYLASGPDHTILLSQNLGQVPEVYAGVRQSPGLTNAPRLESLFRNPSFLAFNQADGTLFVADSANNVIRRVLPGPGGRVETLAGSGAAGSQDGAADTATFRNPQGVALDNRGNLWVVDSGNHTIRKINLATRTVTTVAGEAGAAGAADGGGNQVRFSAPTGIALQTEALSSELERFFAGRAPAPVRMIVADTGNGLIRRISENAQVETLAAAGAAGLAADGPKVFAATAPLQFNSPTGIAVDAFGNVYLSEPGTGKVRTILRNGDVVDATQTNTFTGPRGLAVSRSGGIVVASSNRSAQEIRFGQPRITNITPAQIRSTGGARLTIRGSNFAPDTIVIVAGTPIPNVQLQDTQTLSFIAPVLPSGRTTLTVLNRGGLAQAPFLIESIPLSELPAGFITTVAGGSTFAGDGAAATAATITPSGIVLDPNGNLLIADVVSHRIRRVDSKTGIVTSVAGNGLYSFSGDGGPALVAALNTPLGIAVDGAGNLFISDSYNQRIRRVDARTGIITTFAGTGSDNFSGDSGQAAAASFNLPTGLAFDTAGNLFISDTLNNRIRRIDPSGVITTVAGDGQARFAGDNGQARNASLNGPQGIFLDGLGNLFIADRGNDRIRKVDKNGIVTTVAGTGQYGSSGDGGPALSAQIGAPAGVAVDADGNVFVADTGYSRVRKVAAADSRISTFAGTGDFDFSGDGGAATLAKIKEPRGLAVDAGGNLFIADTDGRRVRRVDGKTGIISTIAGNGEGAFLGENGPATSASINFPLAVTFDNSGNLFIGDSDQRVRKVDMNTGVITTVAGGGAPADGLGDGGLAINSAIWLPGGIAFDSVGNMYIADTGHSRVRKVDAQTRIITTIAGTGAEGFSGDGGLATQAVLNSPRTLAIDPSGNLLIADEANRRIRRIAFATGRISTVAGNGTAEWTGDGGQAALSGLSNVSGFAMDQAGNIYIPDYGNGRVRRVDGATGVISSLAGGGAANSNPVRATDAMLAPTTLAFDSRLFIMELVRQGVLRMDANGFLDLVAGGSDTGSFGDGGPATAASLSYPASMIFDRFGNLFIADSNNNRIRAVRGPIQ